MRATNEEVLAALGDDELSGYQVAHRVETKWAAEGRRSRFLFWTTEPMMGFSETYRVLDRLRDAGLVERLHPAENVWHYKAVR